MAGKLEAAYAAWLAAAVVGITALEGYEVQAGFTEATQARHRIGVVCPQADPIERGVNLYESPVLFKLADNLDGAAADETSAAAHEAAAVALSELLEDVAAGMLFMNHPADPDDDTRVVRDITISGWEFMGVARQISDPELETWLSLVPVASFGDPQ
jgi:hypothetical protein